MSVNSSPLPMLCVCIQFSVSTSLSWSMFAFCTGEITTKSAPVANSALFGFCATHSDCGQTQFCGNKCWTGQCGPDKNIGMWAAGQFCQPCALCLHYLRSVTASCNMCKTSSKEKSAPSLSQG